MQKYTRADKNNMTKWKKNGRQADDNDNLRLRLAMGS